MKAIEREDRIKNFPPSQWRQRCESCGDDGLLSVSLRREGAGMMDEMAPCPFCLKGLQVEFPQTESGPRKGRWGSEGFWQGQDIPMELLRSWRENRAMPLPSNLEKVRELHKRMLENASTP